MSLVRWSCIIIESQMTTIKHLDLAYVFDKFYINVPQFFSIFERFYFS